ncbi:hypothetical protein V5O48_018093 [Marasmius crinis-equi]|uniref:Uncharacterized protein n=1 Tax=Marasmius crinis-equi TaxID=585013 RepID=A0ABR3EM40_9AGAR
MSHFRWPFCLSSTALPTADVYKNEKNASQVNPPFAVRALSPFRYETEAAFNQQRTCVHGDGPHRLEVRLDGSNPHRFGEQYIVCPYELCGDLPPPRRLEADVLDLVSFLYSLFRKFQVAHEGHVTTINTYNATMEARVHPHDFMVYWFSRLLFLHRKEELSVVYRDAKDQLGRFYRRENGEPMTKDERRAVKSALFIARLPELEAHGREVGDHMLDIPRGESAVAAAPSTSGPPSAPPAPSTSAPPPAQAMPSTPVRAPAQGAPSVPPSAPPAQAATTFSEDMSSPPRLKRKLAEVLDETDSRISPGKRARDAIIAEALRTREPRMPEALPMALPPVPGPSTATSSTALSTNTRTSTDVTATSSTTLTPSTAGTSAAPPATTDSTVASASVNTPFPRDAEYIVISDTDD